MKQMNRILLLFTLLAIPALTLLSHQTNGQIPTGPECESSADCPIGYGDCGPDPDGGSNMVCLPMFCGSDSDCLTGMCDVGVCSVPVIDIVADAFVVTANDPDTGECQVGQVDPNSGEYQVMANPGCNECGGIDTDHNGNLLVACAGDGAMNTGALTRNGVAAGRIVELQGRTGNQISANVHGRSNYISDIAVLPDCLLISHETLDEDTVHKHDRDDNFLAIPRGPTGLDVEKAGLAAPADLMYFTLATNESGTPSLYDVDPETGEAMFVRTLQFPPDVIAAASAGNSTRAVAVEDIRIEALVAIPSQRPLITFGVNSSGAKTRAGVFPIEDADYAVLLTKDDPAEPDGLPWAAIGLIDRETGQVDHVLEILADEELLFTGLTLKRPVQRNVPTLSEWGLIATATVLGFIGIIAMRRKINYVGEN